MTSMAVMMMERMRNMRSPLRKVFTAIMAVMRMTIKAMMHIVNAPLRKVFTVIVMSYMN